MTQQHVHSTNTSQTKLQQTQSIKSRVPIGCPSSVYPQW